MIRILAALLLLAGPAAAQTAMVGDIHVERPMLRETPPNGPVAGGFLTLWNGGTEDDALVSAAIDAGFEGDVQVHRMDMLDGVMRMSEVTGSIPIPAGETVTLAPGGLHLMLMDLAAPLTAGESLSITLTFARAGAVTLDFPVMTLAEIRAAGERDDAAHGAMRHGTADTPAAKP